MSITSELMTTARVVPMPTPTAPFSARRPRMAGHERDNDAEGETLDHADDDVPLVFV